MPRFVEVAAPPPTLVPCVAKPGRACLAGQLILSPQARALWTQHHGPAPFPFDLVALQPRVRVETEVDEEEDDEGDEDDADPPDGKKPACACDEVYVGSDGRFEMQLVPGLYDVLATTRDDLFNGGLSTFAATERASLGPAELLLNVSRHLRGVVRNGYGLPVPHVRVAAKPAAGQGSKMTSFQMRTNEEGAFDFPHLQDANYSVTVTSPRYRRVHLSTVSPKHVPLDIVLTRAPALVGMVAAEEGACPSTVVAQGLSQSFVTTSTEMPDCTFFFSSLPHDDQLRVHTKIGGRNVEQHLTIPAVGDPPVVCLGGPCTHSPAVLLVMPIGGTLNALSVSTEGDDDNDLGQSMVTSGGFSQNRHYPFAGFRAGQTVRVGEDENQQVRVTLQAGINEVMLPVSASAQQSDE